MYYAHLTDENSEAQIRVANCPGLSETEEEFLGLSARTGKSEDKLITLVSVELC